MPAEAEEEVVVVPVGDAAMRVVRAKKRDRKVVGVGVRCIMSFLIYFAMI